MKRFIIFLLTAFTVAHTGMAQSSYSDCYKNKKGTLQVHYLQHAPFCYTDASGKFTGIEIDILQAFVTWLKERKEIDLKIEYKSYTEFPKMYDAIRNSANGTVGLGSVTVTEDRKKDVKFAPAYLKNTALLITAGKVPTLSSLNEMGTKFANLTALALVGSAHESMLAKLRTSYYPKMKFELVKDPLDVAAKISAGGDYFGFIDVLSYHDYLTRNKGVYIKRHFVASSDDERFAFILPKNSDWDAVFSEFFESGFGFASTSTYEEILKKHLSYEVIKEVSL